MKLNVMVDGTKMGAAEYREDGSLVVVYTVVDSFLPQGMVFSTREDLAKHSEHYFCMADIETDPDTYYEECVACSGELRDWRSHRLTYHRDPEAGPGAKSCEVCGGLHWVTDRATLKRLVDFNLPMMEGDPDELRYFDVLLTGQAQERRVHGWYDPSTRRVVQFG